MYLSQHISGAKLKEIAGEFGLQSIGSIPTTINKLKCLLNDDKTLLTAIEKMISKYDS